MPGGDHRLGDHRPGHLAQAKAAGLLHVEERLHVAGLLGKLQHLASRLEQDVGEGRLGDLGEVVGGGRVGRGHGGAQRWHHRVADRRATQGRPEKSSVNKVLESVGGEFVRPFRDFIFSKGLAGFYLVVIVGSVVIVDSTTDFRIDEE